jgi:Tfp pilus assembly pilus retraction ATPase PilT
VAALEVLVGVPALRNLIREDKTAQILSVIQTGAQHGMQSLDQSLRDLVMQGRLAREEAMRKSSNPKLFEGAPSGPAAGSAAGAAAAHGGMAPARPGVRP